MKANFHTSHVFVNHSFPSSFQRLYYATLLKSRSKKILNFSKIPFLMKLKFSKFFIKRNCFMHNMFHMDNGHNCNCPPFPSEWSVSLSMLLPHNDEGIKSEKERFLLSLSSAHLSNHLLFSLHLFRYYLNVNLDICFKLKHPQSLINLGLIN
jgi:hypothetical protein